MSQEQRTETRPCKERHARLTELKFYYRLRQKIITIFFLIMTFKFSLMLTAKDFIFANIGLYLSFL